MVKPSAGGSVGWSIIPYNRKCAGLIPGQGTYLGCGSDPWGTYGRQPIDICHIDVSLCLSLSPCAPPHLSQSNKHILGWSLSFKSVCLCVCVCVWWKVKVNMKRENNLINWQWSIRVLRSPFIYRKGNFLMLLLVVKANSKLGLKPCFVHSC